MTSRSGYSPQVALTLVVNGSKLALSHVGPDDVTIREASHPIPPTDAELLITVDGETESYRVFLPNGIPGVPQKVAYI